MWSSTALCIGGQNRTQRRPPEHRKVYTSWTPQTPGQRVPGTDQRCSGLYLGDAPEGSGSEAGDTLESEGQGGQAEVGGGGVISREPWGQ